MMWYIKWSVKGVGKVDEDGKIKMLDEIQSREIY